MPLTHPRRPMTRRPRVPGGAVLAAVAIAALTGAVAAPAVAQAAPSPDAVISEVYGGGGNSGATLTTDFVELGNRSAAVVSLAGFSVQYLPASASAGSSWQVTALAGAVAPDARYLVAEARGAGGTTELPAPDATGTIAMSATAGTIALVQGTAALTCKTVAECAADTRIRDLVGYGSAVVREGTAAPATTNTTSVARAVELPDTDVNSADFTAGDPTPVNAAGDGSGGGGEEPPTEPGDQRIHDVQGATRISPLDGERVEGLPGIVTAVRAFGSARGFWFQDRAPDGNGRTSEALFAFTGATTPSLAVGDDVLVSGTVDEFRPSSATGPNQAITQLTGALWTVLSSGSPLPAAEVLTPTTVPQTWSPPYSTGGNIEPNVLAPGMYALDFYESREGMRLQVADARVVGPTTEFGELWITSKPAQNPTPRGGTAYLSYGDPNSGRIKIESLIPFAERPFPVTDVNDRLAGATAGVLDYDSFGGYTLLATELGEVVDGGLARETTRAQRPNELAVATYNVENLDPADDPAKFAALADGIVTGLASPDIVTLEEIQDNTGPTNDGTVAADQTLRMLVDAIVAAGGPSYEFRQIDPVDGADGGQPGGNIRNGFLFNPDRVTFRDRPGGDATTPVEVVDRPGALAPALSVSPGRIDPQNPAWENSRKPVAGEFVFNSKTIIVVANHFASKGGDQPLHGRFQPPTRSSEVQRHAQAQVLRGFVDDLYAADRRAQVVVAGDLNDFQFSRTLGILTGGDALVNPIDALPAGERYTYVFDGNSQVLDHILLGNLRRYDYDIVHINAEFADQVSDHDPQVVRLRP